MANGNGDKAYIEKARTSGRAVVAKEMTKGRQAAVKALLKRNGSSSNGAFSAAEAEQQRRMRGIGGKGMVR